MGAHFLGSRAASSVLLLGDTSLHSCAIWDDSLDSLPQQCGQWTVSSFQDLQKGRGSVPGMAPSPSLCYFLPLGNTWREGPEVGLAWPQSSLPPLCF